MVILLLFMGVASAETSTSAPIQGLMEEGTRLMRSGKWEDAILFFESLAKEFPEEAEIYLRLGVSYLETRQFKEAEDAFKEVIRLNPAKIDAYLRLAGLLEALQRLPEALTVYDQVILLAQPGPMQEVSRFKVQMINGILQARSQNFDAALTFFKAAAAIAANDPGVYYNIGLIYLQLKDEKLAEAAFKKVTTIDPKHQDAYVKLGNLYEKQEKIELALKVFDKVLEINSESPSGQIARSKIPVYQGRLLARQGRFDEALTLFSQALSFSREQPELYYNIGKIFLIKKMPKEAEQSFLNALSFDSNHQDAYLQLGNLYEGQGRLEEALGAFIRSVEVDPRTPGGISANRKIPLLQGTILVQKGRLDEALKIYEEALTFSPEQAAIFFNMGTIYLQLGNGQKAIEVFLKTIEQNPKNQQAYLYLGSLFEQQGVLEKANRFYEEAVQVDPKSTLGKGAIMSAYSVRGKIAMRSEEFDVALKWFKSALDVQPNNPANYYNLGAFYQQINDLESSALAFEKVVTLDPKDKKAYVTLANIRVSQVLDLIQKLNIENGFLSILPGTSPFSLRIGLEEKMDMARIHLERLLKVTPEEITMLEAVLRAKIEEKRPEEESIEDLEWLLPITSGALGRFVQIRSHLLQGVLFGRAGNLEAAQAQFEALLKIDPEESIGYFNLGFIYVRRKDAEGALRHFKKAVDLSPADQSKRIKLATFYQELGQAKKALEQYQELLLAKDLPEEFREEIEERIAHLFVDVSVTFQTTVDNNITLSDENPAKDTLSTLIGQYQRVFDYGEGHRLAMRVTPQLSSYFNEQISFFSTSTRFYYEKQGYKKRKTVEYEYLVSLFEGSLSSQGHEVAVSGFSSFDDGVSLAGDARFRVFDSTNDSDSDAYQPSISGTYFMSQWAGGRLTLATRAFANLNITPAGKKFSFLGASPSIGYTRGVMRGIQMNVSYAYTYKDYLYLEPGFSKKRIAQSHSLGLGFTIGLERGLQIIVNGSWFSNQSNLSSIPPDTEGALVTGNTSSLGQYEKIVGTVGLRLTF